MTSALSGSDFIDTVCFREGRLDDCQVLAELINTSADGAVEYLLADDSGFALDKMSLMLQHEVYYSYANTLVAEFQQEVIGMVLSFSSDGLQINDQLDNHYQAAKLDYINYFVENKIPNCWHLDAICINADFRSAGVGGKLLNLVKQRAREYSFKSVGVYVFASNTAAIKFYQRNGFVMRKKIDVSQHEFLHSKNYLLQMECML